MPATVRVSPVTVLDELAAWCQTLGLGIKGTTIRLFKMPHTPVVCRALRSTGGPVLPDGILDVCRVQLLVRDTDARSCAAMAQRYFAALDNKKPNLPSIAAKIVADHGVGVGWTDQNGYEIFSLNFTLTGMVRVI